MIQGLLTQRRQNHVTPFSDDCFGALGHGIFRTEEVKTGLAAYGHREKAIVKIIEIIIPAGSSYRKTLLEKVDQISLHVVGFDVNLEQQKQLACLADAGSGIYYGAADAAGPLTIFQQDI